MSEEAIRTFIAIDFPQEIKKELAVLIQEFQKTGVKATWSKVENLHLTLKFLGETPLDQLEKVKEALNSVAGRLQPFQASLRGMGGFPNNRRPRVVWVGVAAGEKEMVALAGQVEAALEPLGYEKEEREFTPHLTLGRIKFPKANRALEEKFSEGEERSFGEWQVEEIELVKSTLHPAGPIYEVIHRAKFY